MSDQTNSRDQQTPQLLNSEEFVQRLARDLCAKGDPDLPLSFYLEEARRLLLSGKNSAPSEDQAPSNEAANDHVFQSWALRKG